MKADFSGYATKAGLRCSDGRVIMPNAFAHQDKVQVPLVWQHGHTDPENVLGHVLLENRDDGVYAYAFFNNSKKAAHAKELVEHKDINALSIWANQLIEKAGRVLHGAIREVSLVLSGANPGALIENVTIRHDGMDTELDDEAIIYTDEHISLEHSDVDDPNETDDDSDDTDDDSDDTDDDSDDTDDVEHTDLNENAQEIYDSLNDDQRELLHSMLDTALSQGGELEHADLTDDATVQEVYESMNEQQKQVLHYMLGEALASAEAQHDNLNNQEGSTMTRIFEKQGAAAPVLSHDDLKGIVADATKSGSLKDAVEQYALAHGIENIDVLFPDAQALDKVPEYLARRNEWVSNLLSGVRKSPFSRIKTLYADITMDEARAKGYVTGALKKEEFFSVSKRVTTPTTIYKKQKLDRDDMVDITDFDVVTWLKAEMRLMLDEEIARAILIGDGRDVSHEDKINEQNIRPIATDHELYTTTINVNIDDTDSTVEEIVEAIILNRHFYKGSGLPTMYTTETYIAKFLLLKDGIGRRMYKTLSDLATELRVKDIVPVEVMEEATDVVAVIVNPTDYVVGATAGGQVSMFDDFDIDYNQHKYLIETRMCGALTKLKSAMVVKKVASALELVTPAEPDFDPVAGELTITDQTGVVYKDGAGTTLNALGSPYTVASGDSITVNATPDTGYYFSTSEGDSWVYKAD